MMGDCLDVENPASTAELVSRFVLYRTTKTLKHASTSNERYNYHR